MCAVSVYILGLAIHGPHYPRGLAYFSPPAPPPKYPGANPQNRTVGANGGGG